MNENLKPNTETVEKISVEDLIKDFKILDVDNFSIYMRDIWKVQSHNHLGSF